MAGTPGRRFTRTALPILRKRRVLLSIIAVLFAAGWYLISSGDVVPDVDTGQPRASLAYFFPRQNQLPIDLIEVTHPSKRQIQARLRPQGWEVGDGQHWYPMSQARAESLLRDKQGRLEIDGELSGLLQGDNPANHELAFGVTESSGLRVRFFSGRELIEDLYVGRSASNGPGLGSFLRRPEENAVYLFAADLADNFAGDRVESWRRRELFPGLIAEQLTQITVSETAGNPGYRLWRGGESGWSIESGDRAARPADPAVTAFALDQLCRLQAAEFLGTAEEPPHSSEKTATIAVLLEGRQAPLHLWLFPETKPGSGIWAAAIEGGGETYGIFWPFAILRNPEEYLLREGTIQTGSAEGGERADSL
ncbi:DUF4340 domain-containing protein [Candidatus Poribacteria bacterium]|nr:DUF4340 domain-containing protein [Candidatus Poribacteria bacterium]